MKKEPLLKMTSISKSFAVRQKTKGLFKPVPRIQAVRNVSLTLYQGEIYGLVGESGSGKTTVGRAILRLHAPDSGAIRYQDIDLINPAGNEKKRLQKDIQMIYQDPYSSLNPRMKIGKSLEEVLIIHQIGTAKQRKQKVLDMLEKVGLGHDYYTRYPNELSGGQRQRISIARALIVEPELIVCDEPVSALDVSIQEQILLLLLKLQQEMKLTLLFITHDLSVVHYLSNRIGIMHNGQIVEEALTDDMFQQPTHPYTQKLLAAIPVVPLEENSVGQASLPHETSVEIVDEQAFSQRAYGHHTVLDFTSNT